MSADWVLAVDFGTTTTAAAVRPADDDRAELVRFGDDYRIPSAVMLDADGSLVAGPQVAREAELFPERVERFPKRQLGEGKVLLVDTWFDDVELVAAVLAHAARQARSLFDGDAPTVVRLTHPSRWEGLRQDALRVAAERAGLGPVELLPEPVAAARGLVRRRRQEVAQGAKVAVFDFGGGTLDIALLERRGDTFVVIGDPGGDDHLGGEDIDDLLIAFLASKLPPEDRERLFDPEATESPAVWRRAAYTFARQVKLAKESLTTSRVQRLALPSPPLADAFIELVESDVGSAVGGAVQRAADRLQSTVRRSGLSVDDLAQVYLVGGSSRLALVQRKLGPALGNRLVSIGDPKGMVALGAAEVPLPARPAAPTASTADPPRQVPPEPPWRAADGVPRASVPAERQPATDASRSDRGRPPATSTGRPVENGPVRQPAGGTNQRVAPGGSPLPMLGSEVRAAADAPFRLVAGDLYQQVGWPPRAHLVRWLVGEGDYVALGAPLAVVALLDRRAEPRTLVSPYAGVLAKVLARPGRTVDAPEPLADYRFVKALTLGACRLDERVPAVVLELGMPAPVRPASDAVVAWVDGFAYSVMYRNRFAFPVVPGSHQVKVTSRFGQRWCPMAPLRVAVAPAAQPHVRYEPPATVRQPGRIWQS